MAGGRKQDLLRGGLENRGLGGGGQTVQLLDGRHVLCGLWRGDRKRSQISFVDEESCSERFSSEGRLRVISQQNKA